MTQHMELVALRNCASGIKIGHQQMARPIREGERSYYRGGQNRWLACVRRSAMTRCLGLVPAASLYVAQKLMAGSVFAAAAVSSRTTTGLACAREPLLLPLGCMAEPTRKQLRKGRGADQVVGEAAAGGDGRVAQAQRARLECKRARRPGWRGCDRRQCAQHAHSRRVKDKVARCMASQQRAPAPARRSRRA